jgi:hypothetical protein
MDYAQRLHAQRDKRNEEKTMSVDEKVFREATLWICSSLSIVEAQQGLIILVQSTMD